MRQIRIRLASAKKVYEVAGKESEYIIRLLKNEEEIVLMFASQAKGSDLSPTENRALRLNWSGKQIDLVEIVSGVSTEDDAAFRRLQPFSSDCSVSDCRISTTDCWLSGTVKTDGPRF